MNWAQNLEVRKLWDRRFIQLAYCVRAWSKDSRPVGAVLVNADRRPIGLGYNGFPAAIEDAPPRLADQELKRYLTVHAELNCVLNAVSDTTDCTIYVTRFPCHECAKVILQKRISRVVSPSPDFNHDTWGWSQKLAHDLFKEAGIEMTEQT